MSQAASAVAPSRPHHRPNCWAWARTRPLVSLPAEAWAKLPKLAGPVMAYLGRHEQRRLFFDYPKVAGEMAVSVRRLQRTVRTLRDLGLVDLHVRVKPLRALDEGSSEWLEGYRGQTWLTPLASVMARRDRTLAAYVPKESLSMVEQRKTYGGKRAGAGRKRKSSWHGKSISQPANCLIDGGAEQPDANSSRRPLILNIQGEDQTVRKLPAGEGTSVPSPAAGFSFSEESEGDLIDFDLSASNERPSRPTRLPMEERGPHPSIPTPDKVPMSYEGWNAYVPELPNAYALEAHRSASSRAVERANESLRQEGKAPTAESFTAEELSAQLRELQALFVVRSYQRAVRHVYGIDVPLFVRRGRSVDLTREKQYPQLVEAARVLCDHAIPPTAWAAWRLEYAKKRGAKKPLGITQIMQPKTIERLRGFFRKEYVGPSQTLLFERWHAEQAYRADEARARWAFGPGVNLRDLGFSYEKWYGDMRRAEIAQGIVDPLDCWPTKDRHSRAPLPNRPVRRS